MPLPSPTHQPVVATYPAPGTAPADAETKKPVETHGIHNVVSSGKGDMLAPPPAAAQPPAPAAQYSYGQANTAGNGAAFR
jgi:hypothetical protein